MGSVDLLLIAGLLLMGIAVYLFVSTFMGQDDAAKLLQWATDNEPKKSQNNFIEFSRPLVHRFSLNLAAKIKSPLYRKSIAHKINTAGLSRVINVDEFIGLQILWGVLFPILLSLMNFALELNYPPLMVVLLGGIGFYFPHLHVNTEKKKRYQSVIVDLPFFIDLLALSTEAGMDFFGAIQRVVEKSDPQSVLASEFNQVLQDNKLGQSKAQALKAMADRLDISEVTSFIAVLIDADATGASIGNVLKQQAVQMRVERFARAEKAGARASQAILLPLVLFIVPAIFIMILGPVVLQMLGAR